MNSTRAASCGLTVAVAILLTASSIGAAGTQGESDRSRELLRYVCASDFGASDLTLFANGTLRLWSGSGPQRKMTLAELSEAELASYLGRLSSAPFDQPVRRQAEGPDGELIEQCELVLTLDGLEPESYRFGRMEGLSLDLASRLAVANELQEEVTVRARGSGFPRDYLPRPGDILVHKDGSRYRIERYTVDGRGVEVAGIDTPLLLYVEVTAVTGEFEALEKKRQRK